MPAAGRPPLHAARWQATPSHTARLSSGACSKSNHLVEQGLRQSRQARALCVALGSNGIYPGPLAAACSLQERWVAGDARDAWARDPKRETHPASFP